MTNLPRKIESRLSSGLRKYQKLFRDAKDRDVNESDTVRIITDFLDEVLGFDKYTEVTSEYAIRGTYVDLAVKLGSEVQYLIEAKAVGVSLKNQHLRQLEGYASRHGINWAVLTNGGVWRAYNLSFGESIRTELIFELDLLSAGYRDRNVLQQLFLLSKEGMTKSAIREFQEQKDACSPFLIAQVLLADRSLNIIRRELRRISPKAKITSDDISALLREDVLKRELIDSDEAKTAAGILKKSVRRALRKSSSTPVTNSLSPTVESPAGPASEPIGDPEP